ncbi:VanZ family protein [Nocardioides zeicaulis]|uniref:VanZ family protein n=1 Tax=Nocardioides zeicaulis TaxID=1776857 RepID=A0ABV6E2T7_9ACTN
MFARVPVLPVVVPLAAVVLALLLWRLRDRRLLSAARGAVAVALSVYAAGVVANTVFPLFLDKPASGAAWDEQVNLTPLVGYEVADAVMNVGVFVPLGILIALASPASRWTRVLAAGAAVSLGIELTQYVTARTLGGGHIADLNDLAFNVVGTALGVGALLVVEQVPLLRDLLDQFRWTSGTARPTESVESSRR